MRKEKKKKFFGIYESVREDGEHSPLSAYRIQSTLVISNSNGLSEILRDIRSSTYQVCRIEEKINLINHI